MCSLDNIWEFLNIDENTNEVRLRDGKKKKSKNRYYWGPDVGYVVHLGGDRWTVLDNSDRTRELLTNHTWYCDNYGYVATNIPNDEGVRTTIKLHRLVSECPDDLMVDHRNRLPYDNRLVNLRNITARENMRNKSKRYDNVSGKQGVYRTINHGKPIYQANIYGNNGKQIRKNFSITKLGEAEAKRLAIECRRAMEIQLGYLGE